MMRCDSCSASVPDLVGQLLRGHQRGAEVPLLLPVLLDDRLRAAEIVAQAISFAQRLFVPAASSATNPETSRRSNPRTEDLNCCVGRSSGVTVTA